MNKKPTIASLMNDGIAQIKTKRQLLAQGLIVKTRSTTFPFRWTDKVKYDPGFSDTMYKDFGKVLNINQWVNTKNKWVDLVDTNTKRTWSWPIEAILK